MASSSVPPTFANLGKGFKDLVTEVYDVKSGVTITSKTSFGLTLSTVGSFDKTSNWLTTKGIYSDKFGCAEIELCSKKGKVWSKLVLPNLIKPAKLTLTGGFDPDHKDRDAQRGLSAKAEVEYKRDHFSGTSSVLVIEQPSAASAKLDVAGVGSFQGLALGGEAKFFANSGAVDLTDYNFRAEYAFNQFLGAFRTEKKAAVLGFSILYKHNSKLMAGVEYVADASSAQSSGAISQSATFGLQEKLDEKTTIKAKADILGNVSTALEQSLPYVTARGTMSWNVSSSSVKPQSFALALLFGDK